MDVDADGSDPDRLPAGNGAPANFKAGYQLSLGKENGRA